MEAMVQAYRGPELGARLSRGNAEEHAVLAALIAEAAAAGQIRRGCWR